MSDYKITQALFIHFHQGQKKEVSALEIMTSASTIQVGNYLSSDNSSLLFSFTHNHQTSQLDLTGIVPYMILQFGETGKFKGASLSLGLSSGPFSLIVQSKFALIIPFDPKLALASISHLEIDEGGKSPGEKFHEDLRRSRYTNPSEDKSGGFIMKWNKK